MLDRLRRLFSADCPTECRAAFRRETALLNLSRVRPMAQVIIGLEILMIVGMLLYQNAQFPAGIKGVYLGLYLAMLLVQAIALTAAQAIDRSQDPLAAARLARGLAVWTLAWGAAVSLVDQAAYQQVIVYVSGMFAIAVFFQLPTGFMAVLYAAVEVAFVWLLPLVQPNALLANGHVVNTICCAMLAWTASRMVYARRVQEYLQAVAIRQQQAELEAVNRQLQVASATDSLTGLLNRRTLEQRLEQLWSDCAVRQEALTVIMVDIDSFKSYNDANGHLAGDECLRQVAAVLRRVAPEAAAVGRYGGEEFILALPASDSSAGRALADSIRREVEGLSLAHRLSPVCPVVTVSVGQYSALPQATETVESFVHQADMAMYQAKHQRGNQVVVTA